MFELNFLASSLFIGIKNSLGVKNFKNKASKTIKFKYFLTNSLVYLTAIL